ncbi:MAG TPA: YbaB/EbfC family nucleoid-associated protein [Bdellovibrionales bacterium]|nr:YbaB/EbfC family nucleoid-associated protein [Pseudobdellovibrionaceae bacterium]HAG90679.1 YbaB/EbfC family nucleoid-associated protein [Bdellovibrionales bacterium]|tara:strand:- start:403 stop:723 length:321 start_codon:yes stop_codon:yes gene_type:complete
MKGMGGGGMQALMRQANQMQNKMKKLQEDFQAREFEGTSGGGAVKVVALGNYQLKSVEINPDAMDDQEMLQDLILTATNEVMKTVKTTYEQEMSKVTGGFSMPGMF